MSARLTPVHRLAAARLVSLTGGEAAYIALVALVYERTGSSLWVSAALLAMIGVAGVCSPFAGALGDRFDRRRVLIASDLVAAALFVAIATTDAPWQLCVLAGLAAAAESPFIPTSTAAVPNLVADSADLPRANALVATGRNIGHLCGPLLGGLLVASVGAQAAFVGNAVTFLVSALLVASIRQPLQAARGTAHDGDHVGLMAGFRFLAADRVLRTIAIAWSIVLLGIGGVLVAELPLAEELGAGAVGYGLLVAAWGGGSLLGVRLAPRSMRRRPELTCITVGAFVMALSIGSVAVAPVLAVAVALMAAGGIADGIASVAEETLVQRRVPDAVRSRVIAAIETAVLVALALSFGFAGFLLEAVGPRATYLVAGVVFGIGALVIAVVLRDERSQASIAQPPRSSTVATAVPPNH
jgi:MFS family permease